MKTGHALMNEVLNSQPNHGAMDFWWLGQMGYIIRLGSVTLLIDGYFDVNPVRLQPSPIQPEELRGIDYILGTHDHSDHIDRPAWKSMARFMPHSKFIVPAPLADELSCSLEIDRQRIIGISEGSVSFQTDDLTIEGIASSHETLDQDEATGWYPYTGYVISGNGIKLYHAGDCVVYDGLESKLKQHGTLDAVFLPINGRDGARYRSGCIGNMTFQEAVCLACGLQPRLSVPGHYDMFPGNTANPLDFTDYLEARNPSLAFWIGGRGTKVHYERDTDLSL